MFGWQQILDAFTKEDKSILFILGISLLIFIVFWIFRKIFTTYIFKMILRLTKKTRGDFDTSFLLAFEKPLRTFFIFIGLFMALNYSLMELPLKPGVADSVSENLLTLFRASIILLVAWGLFNLSSESATWLERIGKRLGFEFDQILLPFVSKIIRFIILALTFAIVAGELGYDVNGFVAGLGLGGLAFALAAQDTVKNIFGGVVIITEKPFTIGDWIETPTVEGTVEDLTFRSTKIRTFAHSVVTVPNSTLANEAITNWSQMGKRRISFQLRVPFTTPRVKIQKCVSDIRAMLRQHEEVDQETLFVHFDKISQESLEMMLYFFTKTTNWGKWLEVKEDIYLKIMEILEREGVSIAMPTRAIYVDSASLSIEKEQDMDTEQGKRV